MKPLIFKPLLLAGIAIQPENIHLVQLKKVRSGYFIERVRRYALPAAIFSEGKIIEFSALQTALTAIVKEESLHAMQAAVCVPSNQVKMQRIVVPRGLSALDIEAEISTQVYRAMPAKADALAIDFRTQAAEQADDVQVFFAAARKDYIQRFQACVEAAGLSVKMMDVDVFALLRAVRFALKDVLTDNEKLCSLYLGEDYAVMTAEHGNDLLFHQQWDGESVSRLAMTRMQWVEWCCHTYQHQEISSLAIGGRQDFIYQAVKMITACWSCKIYEPDPFLTMRGATNMDKAALHDGPSAFLLACGLAMREPLPW